MPAEWVGANVIQNNGSASTSFSLAGLSLVSGQSRVNNILRVWMLAFDKNVTVSAGSDWSLLHQDSSGSRTTAVLYRWLNVNDETNIRGSWSSSAYHGGVCLSVLGADPDEPFGDVQTDNNTGTNWVAPSVTATDPGSLALWWFGGYYLSGANSRPVTLGPDMVPAARISGDTGFTSSDSRGVNGHCGMAVPEPGVATGVRRASISTTTPYRSGGLVVRPAPGQTVRVSQFLPFFGR